MPFDEDDNHNDRPFNPWPSVVGISEDNPNGVKVTNITQLEVLWDGRSPVKFYPTPEEGVAIAAAKANLEFLELCARKAADPSVTFLNPLVNSSYNEFV